ncbi:MAG: hypothetical protein V7741_14730 [Hyphomonas sp.]
MTALSTYLGHANPHDTYWYLEATPKIYRQIAQAAEARRNGDAYRLCEIFPALLAMSDTEVGEVLAFAMAETLEAGGPVVEAVLHVCEPALWKGRGLRLLMPGPGLPVCSRMAETMRSQMRRPSQSQTPPEDSVSYSGELGAVRCHASGGLFVLVSHAEVLLVGVFHG